MANSNGWGDGASNNSIGWGQGANNNIGWGDSHAKSWAGLTDIVGIDSASSAYFTATGITGATQQTAIDNLVKGLKADGLWSKMKAVYPFVTDNRNLLSYTEDFDNASWGKGATSVTANTAISPSGIMDADTYTANGSSNVKQIFTTLLLSASTNYTLSIYAKKDTNDFIQFLSSSGTFGGSFYANFDLQNGVIGQYTGTLSAPKITDVGDGWYRCEASVVSVASPTSGAAMSISLITSETSPRAESNSLSTSVFLWGAQLELGSTATTYQPIATTQQAFISSQFKYNLVNPVDSDAAFRLVFNGGWTHSSNGATPNGTNGYADTKLVPSSVLTQNSTHLSFYSRSNILNTLQFEIGSFNVGTAGLGSSSFGISYNSAPNGHMRNRVSTATPSTGFIPTDARGLFTSNRTLSTQQKAYQNGVLKETATVNSDGLSTLQIAISANRISAVAVGDYSAKQTAFSSIGDGLTDTEAANLYTRVQAFQTSLSRQV